MLLQPVNEQCWSNEAEEGEDLLEVRCKVWGRFRGGSVLSGIHTHTDEMEKYLALKMCAHIKNYDWCIICVLMIF